MLKQSQTEMAVQANADRNCLDRRCVLMGLVAAISNPTALMAASPGARLNSPTENLFALLEDMDDNHRSSFQVVGQALIDRELVPADRQAIRAELDKLLQEATNSTPGGCAEPWAVSCIGEFVSVDGWMMSRSEALVCALACSS